MSKSILEDFLFEDGGLDRTLELIDVDDDQVPQLAKDPVLGAGIAEIFPHDEHDFSLEDPPIVPATGATGAPRTRVETRGRKPASITLTERREKNREIQARYRLREKQRRSALQDTHSQLAADLEKAHIENEAEKSRNAVLESIVQVKDLYIDGLRRQVSVRDDHSEQSSTSLVSYTSESEGDTQVVVFPRHLIKTVYDVLNGVGGGQMDIDSIAEGFLAQATLTEQYGDLAVKCALIFVVVRFHLQGT